MSKKSKKASAKTKTREREQGATYRVLAKQALSLDVSDGGVESFSIQGMECRIAVKASHADPAKQRKLGGSTIAVEFKGPTTYDLFAGARVGTELIEDFLSAITVVSNTTFGPCEMVQVARLDAGRRHNCEFMQMLPLPLNHWHERITGAKLQSARNLLAHWDGLEGGKRLRRAARNYRSAAGTVDDVTAFQEAYIGLETMEKPLASLAGFEKHGTEQVKGSCEKCGHEYVRNRTTLVGVRAFVAGGVDLDNADEGRVSDWKLVNKLRNDLMHGLVDEEDLGDRPIRSLLASMHYLHHAICTCSHSPDLASEQYKLARGGAQFVMLGKYSVRKWPALTDWRQIVETKSPMFEWVPHDQYGLVPELSFRNDGVKDLRVGVGRLEQPLSSATMTDIGRMQTERDV
jgi:hypothetical protein